jgi:hypothetical protein
MANMNKSSLFTTPQSDTKTLSFNKSFESAKSKGATPECSIIYTEWRKMSGGGGGWQ